MVIVIPGHYVLFSFEPAVFLTVARISPRFSIVKVIDVSLYAYTLASPCLFGYIRKTFARGRQEKSRVPVVLPGRGGRKGSRTSPCVF